MQKYRGANRTLWLIAGLLALSAIGCRDTVGEVPAPKQFKGPPQHIPSGDATAGVRVAAGPVALIKAQVNGLKVAFRPDPFALQAQENEYDLKENNERIFATKGAFFPPAFTAKPVTVRIEQTEPQPFRRLAGVVVADSVMAIIDMGNGSAMQVIRPGMQIPNSPWRVVSIDSDKAVLRRSGNVKPKEVVVRLQSPSVGGIQPGQAPPGGNPGGGGNFGGGGGGGGGKFGGGGGGAIN